MNTKVYAMSTLAKPPKSHFPNYAVLYADGKVHEFLNTVWEFDGKPFSKKWKKQKLYIENPKLPLPDFFTFGTGKFVCNERARELAAEPLEMCGEFLPVEIEREKGKYWLYNVTNCFNVVDREKSKWRDLGMGDDARILEHPAFIGERLGEESLFKIPEDNGGTIYCLERTGDADVGEFKALVEQQHLIGLEFELVWTEKRELKPVC
jgi:hypothetical protein